MEELQAEKELQASETRFRELFDNINSGVAVYRATDNGEDFIILDLNEPDNGSRMFTWILSVEACVTCFRDQRIRPLPGSSAGMENGETGILSILPV